MQLQQVALFLKPEHIHITIEIVKLVALFCPFAKFLPLQEIGAVFLIGGQNWVPWMTGMTQKMTPNLRLRPEIFT